MGNARRCLVAVVARGTKIPKQCTVSRMYAVTEACFGMRSIFRVTRFLLAHSGTFASPEPRGYWGNYHGYPAGARGNLPPPDLFCIFY